MQSGEICDKVGGMDWPLLIASAFFGLISGGYFFSQSRLPSFHWLDLSAIFVTFVMGITTNWKPESLVSIPVFLALLIAARAESKKVKNKSK